MSSREIQEAVGQFSTNLQVARALLALSGELAQPNDAVTADAANIVRANAYGELFNTLLGSRQFRLINQNSQLNVVTFNTNALKVDELVPELKDQNGSKTFKFLFALLEGTEITISQNDPECPHIVLWNKESLAGLAPQISSILCELYADYHGFMTKRSPAMDTQEVRDALKARIAAIDETVLPRCHIIEKDVNHRLAIVSSAVAPEDNLVIS